MANQILENVIDPFGAENLMTPTHVIEENNVTNKKERKVRVKRNKFYISKDLKKRLNTLIKESQNENAKRIALDILNLKYETESGYNYLGLSMSDYSKISYLDSLRVEKFKDQFIEKKVFNSKSQVYTRFVNWQGNVSIKKINVYDRNFKYPMELLSLKEGLEYIAESGHRISETSLNIALETRNNFIELAKKQNEEGVNCFDGNQNLTDIAYIEIDGEKLYNIKTYFAKLTDSDAQTFLTNYRNNPYSSRARYLYESRYLTTIVQNEFVAANYASSNLNLFLLSNYGIGSQSMYIKPTVVKESKLWDYSIRYHTKIGKIVRKIFPNTYSDVEITDFSEEYRKLIVINKANSTYNEVKGDDIAFFYLEENAKQGGTLGNSCMRYSKCQNYFDIYTKNDFCSLGVVLHNSKVEARALLWTINNETYYDRIYSCDNDSSFVLENIFKAKGYISCYNKGLDLSIEIPKSDFDDYELYPYLDTFKYYDIDEEVLCTYEPDNQHYNLSHTGGHRSLVDNSGHYCAICDEQYDEDNISEITAGYHRGEMGCNNCCTYTGNDEWVSNDDTVEDICGEYYYHDHVVELVDGRYCYRYTDDLYQYHNGDCFVKDEGYDYVEIDGEYYNPNNPEDAKIIEAHEQKEIQEELN